MASELILGLLQWVTIVLGCYWAMDLDINGWAIKAAEYVDRYRD